MEFSHFIEEMDGFSLQEMTKLLKDCENHVVQLKASKGLQMQVDIRRLASSLPLHLMSTVLFLREEKTNWTYLLSGLRLLHSLSGVASKLTDVEQIGMEETKTCEQILDLVFFIFLILARCDQGYHVQGSLPLLHSTLAACNLFLLPSYISSQWQDLANVILMHPQVDMFMETSFDTLHIDVGFVHMKLRLLTDGSQKPTGLLTPEDEIHLMLHQCETSLQSLACLCQQKLFRERLLKNKELCENGGFLSVALAVLKLRVPPPAEFLCINAVVGRLKSKVLSILVQLCEIESVSYLDEVASSLYSMGLAKLIALEVLGLLEISFGKETKQLRGLHVKHSPSGLLLLNSMRIADILSDDSNFRSFITMNITPLLADILTLSREDFLSSWCSTSVPVLEEDGGLEYEPFAAAGLVIESVKGYIRSSDTGIAQMDKINVICPQVNMGSPGSHWQQRTSFLVKIIANLHCFVPSICEEQERDHFFNKFLQCLGMKQLSSSRLFLHSDARKAALVCENLCSLLDHAVTLIPVLLNEEDVQLLSVFVEQLRVLVPSILVGTISQDTPSTSMYESSLTIKTDNFEASNGIKGNLCDLQEGSADTSVYPEVDKLTLMKREKNLSSSCMEAPGSGRQEKNEHMRSISKFAEGSNRDPRAVVGSLTASKKDEMMNTDLLDIVDGQFSTYTGAVEEHESKEFVCGSVKLEASECEEKLRRKRKRNVMNEKQIKLIEEALIEEPELQRNAVLLQSWTEKLSTHGSELTPAQLKNWLNNRKARLARAAREAQVPSEGEHNMPGKACGSSIGNFHDSSESNGEDISIPSTGTTIDSSHITRRSRVVLRAAKNEPHEAQSAEGTAVSALQGMWSSTIVFVSKLMDSHSRIENEQVFLMVM